LNVMIYLFWGAVVAFIAKPLDISRHLRCLVESRAAAQTDPRPTMPSSKKKHKKNNSRTGLLGLDQARDTSNSMDSMEETIDVPDNISSPSTTTTTTTPAKSNKTQSATTPQDVALATAKTTSPNASAGNSTPPVGGVQRRNTEYFVNHLSGVGLKAEHSMAAIVQEKKDIGTRKIVFTLLCVMQLFANFDAGVIPSGLNQIMLEYELTSTEAGWLGSYVYVGLVFSCPITGYLLTKMKSQRKILVASLFLNLVALCLFVLCPSNAKGLLMFTRFLTGLSQAPLFVFPPVWVSEFAPEDSYGLWFALLQAMVPLGITFGFTFTMIFQIPTVFGPSVGWRAAIWMQIAILAPFVFMYSFLRGRYFNVLGGKEARLEDQASKFQQSSEAESRKNKKAARAAALERGVRASSLNRNGLGSDLSADSVEEAMRKDEGPSMSAQLCTILHRPVYLWIVLGLSGLYFVVTGIQFWTVSYMLNVSFLLVVVGGVGWCVVLVLTESFFFFFFFCFLFRC
jgi:MFS family permease